MKQTQFARTSKPVPSMAAQLAAVQAVQPVETQSSAVHYEEQPGWGKLFGAVDQTTGEIVITGYYKTPEIIFAGKKESFSIRFTGKLVGEDGTSISLIGRCTRLPGLPIHLLLQTVTKSSKGLKAGKLYIGNTCIDVGATEKEGKTSGQFYRCLYTPTNTVLTRVRF